jgi:YVTN family beta-propeller protein
VADRPPLTREVGGYALIRELGRGGMAVVYLARQLDLDRSVAVKELSSFQAGSPESVQRFLREARLAGSLGHPNIVMVHEYFEREGIPYIAMEYVERGSLRPFVGRLTLAQLAGVMEGVLAGLAHAEQAGVIHRDLKPENILVTGEGRVKIADFGIAKATQTAGMTSALTATGAAIGTPAYMAPEQAMAEPVGPSTDLYSVGVIAYEQVTGRPPFHGEAPMVLLMRHINEQAPSVTTVKPEVDRALSDWIDRLLVKNPAERPQGAAEAWDSLEEIVIGLLGPRWRREARLDEPDRVADASRPLTPAPFHAKPSDTSPAGSTDEFVTYEPAPSATEMAPGADKPEAPPPEEPPPAEEPSPAEKPPAAAEPPTEEPAVAEASAQTPPATEAPTGIVPPAPATEAPTGIVPPAPATEAPTGIVPPAPATEAPTRIAPPPPATEAPTTVSRSRPTGRGKPPRFVWLGLIGLLVVAGVVAAIVASGSGGGKNAAQTTTTGGEAAGIRTRSFTGGVTVRGPIALAGGGKPAGIVAAGRDAWVADTAHDMLVRIRADGSERRVAVGRAPVAVALDRSTGDLWVANSGSGDVTVLDASGHLRKRSIQVGADPTAISFGSGAAWVARGGATTVTRIDSGSFATSQVGVGGQATALANEYGRVWIGKSDGSLTVLSGKGTLNGTVPQLPGSGTPVAISASNGVWVVRAGGGLARVDPRTQVAVRRTPPYEYATHRDSPAAGSDPRDVDALGGSLGDNTFWAISTSDHLLSRIGTLQPHNNQVLAAVPVGQAPGHLSVDSHVVWVSDPGGKALYEVTYQ